MTEEKLAGNNAREIAGKIIVAGGAGYIGAHVVVELIASGYDVLIVDNFANSSPRAIDRLQEITGRKINHLELDLADAEETNRLIDVAGTFGATGAVHLAGLKAVGESVAEPSRYYRVNINSALNLADALDALSARTIVFSSSATVYGELNENPVAEDGQTGPTNPYGRTKLFIEEMFRDLTKTDADWRICNLRYFNPVGAHPSGLIGEDPNGPPNNLFPYIAQVAVGRREKLSIFGNDYPTPDGTGVRDYIHVVDLAKGHAMALDHLRRAVPEAIDVNLGTGHGYSVLECIDAFKRASNRDVPFEIVERRAGDIAEIYANASRAKKLLGWTSTKTIHDMCTDHWRWQHQNPTGYTTEDND